MDNSPIKLIEQAELKAEQIIQQANLDKLHLSRETEEKMLEQRTNAISQAQEYADKLLREARTEGNIKQQKAYANLEKELSDINKNAMAKQNSAIDTILSMIPNLF